MLQHIIRGISSDCAHLFNQTSDIYDYPVFYDWGMDEWRDGVERKTLMDKYENKKSNKNERAIVKWDYFYKYSKYRMVKCKDNYFQELEDVYHRKETDRHLRISKLRGENDRNKSVKKELIINKIKFLIISFLLIALFGVGLILLIGFTIWIIIKYKHINEKIQENNNEILTRNRDGERLLQQLKNHKQEIENLIPQMEKQYNQQRIVVNEETIEQWHMEELKELEKNALSELGIEIDNVDIQEAISYATERGMKAYQGFKSLFIEGAGMLQELHTPGIDLFHENKEMKTFVIEERIHFRVTYNQFIVPTRHKLCSYRFFYDCIDGRVRGKRTEEYYYEDVVMITTSHETRDFPLAVSDIDKKQEFFTFIMSLKSGEKIMVSLSDHGLVELISERLHAVDEPLVKEIIIINSKNGKYQDELYEIDSRSEEEAKLIVKNIRTQLAKIKKGTGVVRSGTWK